MISFRVDGRSGVPPYRQIVQQARQALRMGLLEVGDQLPTVREVVAEVAVNPNTVLKAYRDLEREGLVEARAGQGTFVLRRPAGPAHDPLAARPVPGPLGRRGAGGGARRRVDGIAAPGHAAGVRPRRFPPAGRNRMSAAVKPLPFGPTATEAMAIETSGLTKRYRRSAALSDCTVTVPEGRISALVGPNGAGKSTLLRLLTGLARPTAGSARVLGGVPRQDPAFLADIGYLAQDVPLFRRLSADDHIGAGAHLNKRWDGASARARLRELNVPLDRAVATLSGGQRAQVGLALALAKRPRLLLLDEPVAALDPLARRHFLATLTSALAEAEGRLTIVLSSHLITDLERICDHLILLAESRVQLCGDIDDLLAEHTVLVGPRKDTAALERDHTLVHATRTARQATLVLRLSGPVIDPAYQASDISLEDLVLAYMGAAAPAAYADLLAASTISTVGEQQ